MSLLQYTVQDAHSDIKLKGLDFQFSFRSASSSSNLVFPVKFWSVTQPVASDHCLVIATLYSARLRPNNCIASAHVGVTWAPIFKFVTCCRLCHIWRIGSVHMTRAALCHWPACGHVHA